MTYYNNETSITAYYCFEKNDYWAVRFAIYELMTLFIIPALLMIFCYFRVIRELWTSTRVITILTHHSSSGVGSRSGNNFQNATTINNNNNNITNQLSSTSKPKTNNNFFNFLKKSRNDLFTQQQQKQHRSYLVRWQTRKNINQSSPPPSPPPIQSETIITKEERIKENSKGVRSSISSSGISSSSISGNCTNHKPGCTPTPSDCVHDYNETQQQQSTINYHYHGAKTARPTKISKIFYCLNNLRILIWLRPVMCCHLSKKEKKRNNLRIKKTFCCKNHQHKGHHRCHKPNWIKRNNHQQQYDCYHYHQNNNKRNLTESNTVAINSMSYQQMKASCCCLLSSTSSYCTNHQHNLHIPNVCTLCTQCRMVIDSNSSLGDRGTVIESEKRSSSIVSHSSFTCASVSLAEKNTNNKNNHTMLTPKSTSFNQTNQPFSNHLCFRLFYTIFDHCCCCNKNNKWQRNYQKPSQKQTLPPQLSLELPPSPQPPSLFSSPPSPVVMITNSEMMMKDTPSSLNPPPTLSSMISYNNKNSNYTTSYNNTNHNSVIYTYSHYHLQHQQHSITTFNKIPKYHTTPPVTNVKNSRRQVK